MDDEENYDDENMDEYNEYEMENDDMREELENLFINAKSSDDPIGAYKSVIELEASNSNDKTFTIRSYKEICIIYLLRDDYENFSIELENLTKHSKDLKEDIFKTKLYEEILKSIESNQDKEEFQLLNFTKFLEKMLNVSEDHGCHSLSEEIKNFIGNNPRYKEILKNQHVNYNFDNISKEYEEMKTLFTQEEAMLQNQKSYYQNMKQ